MKAWLIPFITIIAAACGGVIGSVIKLKSEKRRHLFDHKVDAYKKLITSYRELTALNETAPDYEKYRQKYVEAQEQIELVGSKEVINFSKKFYTENPTKSHEIMKQLIKAMRNDLRHN